MSVRNFLQRSVALLTGLVVSTNVIATQYVYEFDGQMFNSYGSIFFFETVTGHMVIDDSLPGGELVSIRITHPTKGTILSTGGTIHMLNDYFVSDLIRYFGNAPVEGSLGTVVSDGGITIQLSGPIDTLDNNDLVTDVSVLNMLLGYTQPGEGVQLCFPDDQYPYTGVTCPATITAFRLADAVVDIEINEGNPLHPHHDGSDPNPATSGATLPDDLITVAVLGANASMGDPIDFDATQIDVSTVRFGPSDASDADLAADIYDVDNDGNLDATFDFKTSETGYECYQLMTSGTIDGEALGQPFTGSDSVSEQCNAVCH